MAVAADDRVANARVTTDATIGPDDGAADCRSFLDLGLTSHDRVGANLRACLYERSFVDEAGPFEGGTLFDLRVRRDPYPRRRHVAEWFGGVPPIHDVAMHLRVLRGRADINPVAVVNIGDERLLPFDQRREITALDRPGDVAWNAI